LPTADQRHGAWVSSFVIGYRAHYSAIIKVMKNPKVQAWVWLVAWFVPIALALFLSAGTIAYWQAWGYLGVAIATSVPLTLYIINDPILLENRMKAGPAAEQRRIQKIIVLLAGVPGVAMFIIPGLDHRFGWSNVPLWLSIVGDILILASMWMAYRVFKENSFGSATVKIAKDQKLISTGPYAIVRHPMYSSAAVYFIGMALALGSFWGLIPAILTVLALVARLLDEEKFLAQNLQGYTQYRDRVRWRLIPVIF
jgi:protein-S-isoprenylcysteine O-methyltransferase Ste14